MFGEITNRERAGWQRRALKTLDKVLDAAHKHAKAGGKELPTIEWTLDTGLMVIGKVKVRADFESWRDFLDAEMRLNLTHEDGRVVLTAQTKSTETGVTVMVHADISPAIEEE